MSMIEMPEIQTSRKKKGGKKKRTSESLDCLCCDRHESERQ